MNSRERNFWEILSVVAAIACLMGVMQHIYSVQKVEALLEPGPIPRPRSYNAIENAERIQHARALYQLWQARYERDVTAEVAPFLQDAHGDVRISAMRVLARLDTPTVEVALREFIETTADKWQYSGGLSLEWRMALGRAQARDLKGWAKVKTVARSADLSFDEVTMLSAKINEKIKSTMWGTDGYAIMVEMIELLTVMGKEGENIAPFVKQLTLNPAQQVQLKAASLPRAEGTQMLVDYIARLDILTGDVYPLKQCLLNEMDSVSTDILVQKLQEIYSNNGRNSHIGCKIIFSIAEQTGDARVYPLLKALENSPSASPHELLLIDLSVAKLGA